MVVLCEAHLSLQPQIACDHNAQATESISEEGDTERQRKERILSQRENI